LEINKYQYTPLFLPGQYFSAGVEKQNKSPGSSFHDTNIISILIAALSGEFYLTIQSGIGFGVALIDF
jgi:hypothetical protein